MIKPTDFAVGTPGECPVARQIRLGLIEQQIRGFRLSVPRPKVKLELEEWLRASRSYVKEFL